MQYDVYGIGNALVDMEYKIEDNFLETNAIEKGLMTLVEEERQAEIIAALSSLQQTEIKRQCGGSAANSMIAVSQFGGNSFYSFKVADDELGQFYLNDMNANQVGTKNTPENLPSGITGKCIVMVTPDAERTMNTYLGITATLDKEQIDEQALAASKWVYVEGYLVTSPTGQEAALQTMKLASELGVKRSLTMSDPNMVNFFRDNMEQLMQHGIDLLFCNEQEAKDFTQTETLSEVKEALKKYASHFVITLGKEGAVIWDGTTFIDIQSHPIQEVDSNGAGDMFAGAFLYAINNGYSYADAGALASLASAKVVSQFGPRLTTEEIQAIRATKG